MGFIQANQLYLTSNSTRKTEETDTKRRLITSESDCINLYQGVPQGTVLGPLLFKTYINNMKSFIQSPLYLVQYADDTFFVAAKDIVSGAGYLQKEC